MEPLSPAACGMLLAELKCMHACMHTCPERGALSKTCWGLQQTLQNTGDVPWAAGEHNFTYTNPNVIGASNSTGFNATTINNGTLSGVFTLVRMVGPSAACLQQGCRACMWRTCKHRLHASIGCMSAHVAHNLFPGTSPAGCTRWAHACAA